MYFIFFYFIIFNIKERMNIFFYLLGWFFILLIVIAITLILLYSKRIDQCRTWKTLYCRSGQSDGWRCTSLSGPNPTVTLGDTIASVQDTTKLVPCPSSDDIPASGSTPIQYASYVLAPDPTGTCDTTQSDANLSEGCKSTGPLAALKTFPGNPLVIPTSGIINGQNIFDWYCDSTRVKNADDSAKRAAWIAFTDLNPDFTLSKSVTFLGQQGT
jgi:hypothetical protein